MLSFSLHPIYLWRWPPPFFSSSFSGAEAAYEKAIEIDQSRSSAFSTLGYIKQTKDDFEGAEAAFKTSVELDPDDGFTAGRYGEFLKAKGLQMERDGEDKNATAAVFQQAGLLLEKRDGANDSLVISLKHKAEEMLS